MYDVFIQKLDDVHIKIFARIAIREQIENAFKFRVDNYQFTPKYKAGIWDGYIKLFNQFTCLIGTGLLKEVVSFCRRGDYTVYVDPKLLDYGKQKHDILEKYFRSELKPTTDDGGVMEIRDYQMDAIMKSLKFRRVLLESATSSGKSFIIYAILNWLFHNDKINAALIVVPTINLVDQMYSDFDDYSQANDFSSNEWMHKIYQGQNKWSDKPIIISTWQSIFEMESKWFEQYDCFIGDEAHGCEAKSLVKIMKAMTTCPYKIGMSGSFSDFEGSILNLQGLFGPHIKVIGAREMIDRGFASKLEINGIMLEYHKEERKELAAAKRKVIKENKQLAEKGKKHNPGAAYKLECEFIINHPARQRFIRNLAITRKGNTLILFRFGEHGTQIFNDIKAAVPDDRPVFYVSGKVKGKDREKIRKLTETYSNAIIVASYGTFSTGINIKSLSHLIMAFPYKRKIKIVQSIGRILRLDKNKEKAVLWDICDDLQWKTASNYAKDQFVARLRIYRKEQHKYKIKKVVLPYDTDNKLKFG